MFQAFASAQALSLDGCPFVDHVPYLTAGLRFKGAGAAVGGGLQMLVNADGLRWGFDVNFFTVRGVELAHKPLGADLRASLSEPWGTEIAGILGYELDYGHLHPYLDLRFGASFLVWSIDVHSNRLGALTPLSGNQTFPIVVPRLGVAYRFDNGINIDLSTSAAPYGLARAGVFLGFGSHFDFSP